MADPATDPASLEKEFLAAIENASTLSELEEVRLAALGKKGSVSELLKSLGGMTAEERQEQGPIINGLKQTLSQALDHRKSSLEIEALNIRLAGETEDVTLPVQPSALSDGRLHPISQVMEEIVTIFADMGFSVAEGPDVETDFHNFTALNIPESHPARQMHDTFYFEENEDGERLLLRTHTSPVQIRTMEAGEPPFRLIAPGRTYRCDSDQTHTPMFHQVEGLVID
ncbi:MAG: phenylalanine--tRNA ligase subunit alpha, partial [Pseudomonadota bacterium]|nr:phenylalanine--tRNA ligase subunit alpha [Pseudomonadota bacterium]